jgi:hypothetical protein
MAKTRRSVAHLMVKRFKTRILCSKYTIYANLLRLQWMRDISNFVSRFISFYISSSDCVAIKTQSQGTTRNPECVQSGVFVPLIFVLPGSSRSWEPESQISQDDNLMFYCTDYANRC